MTRLLQALREAGMLLVIAAALGFIHTAATERGLFARQDPNQPGKEGESAAPAMISRDQAAALFEMGTALFVDARHEYDFKLGHIRAAVNIPLNMYEAKKEVLDSIPKDRLLVVYCDGAECNSSIELSVKLSKDGRKHVKIFFGGWREWTEMNLPTEKRP